MFGNANRFKEGDAAIGLAAESELAAGAARERLERLRVGDLRSRVFVQDEVSDALDAAIDPRAAELTAAWTVHELKAHLLRAADEEIRTMMGGLASEAIAAVVKLCDDAELVRIGGKVYNPPPGSSFGARGYFGSRIQPNSPTDDPEEILFSVLEGLSYGCGDVVLGVNPVDSDWRNIAALERTLLDVVRTFELTDKTTYCVLGHIDDQLGAQDLAASTDGEPPAPVECAFQSIGGTASCNATFAVDVRKLHEHLARVRRQYFETGQGSEFTNKCAEGVDMVTLEARSYGLARALRVRTGNWTIVNDVAGFIGPEVFCNAEQLRRACLEDLVMGKLHGLPMGLDICSTYHMGVSIAELDAVMDAVMPAGPAYLMAVAGKSDPMLSYITTSFRDHARLRNAHGVRVSDEMSPFFERLGAMAADGSGRTMSAHAGDTAHVYAQYRRAKGDARADAELRAEARTILAKLQARGLDLGHGHDGTFSAPPHVHADLLRNYDDAKAALVAELGQPLLSALAADGALVLRSQAADREVYLRSPPRGEALDEDSLKALRAHALEYAALGRPPAVTVLISDGLNARAVAHDAQRTAFLRTMRDSLSRCDVDVHGTTIVIDRGRVRAGYQVGHELYKLGTSASGEGEGSADSSVRATVHVIGERPGNGQNTFSAYIAICTRARWTVGANHDVCRVVSGISMSSTSPEEGARQAAAILRAGLRPSAGA